MKSSIPMFAPSSPATPSLARRRATTYACTRTFIRQHWVTSYIRASRANSRALATTARGHSARDFGSRGLRSLRVRGARIVGRAPHARRVDATSRLPPSPEGQRTASGVVPARYQDELPADMSVPHCLAADACRFADRVGWAADDTLTPEGRRVASPLRSATPPRDEFPGHLARWVDDELRRAGGTRIVPLLHAAAHSLGETENFWVRQCPGLIPLAARGKRGLRGNCE